MGEYDRYRLIASLVSIFVFCLAMYPIQTITIALLVIFIYLMIKNLGKNNVMPDPKTFRRRAALEQARLYLAPYTNQERNLRLSNKNCSLRLGGDGVTITAKEKINPYRSFKVVKSSEYSMDELWDMMCVRFDYNTSFDGLTELCHIYNAKIIVEGGEASNEIKNTPIQRKVDVIPKNVEPKEKLDVNNASEVELTALPGVSIVMAKKLIKKREEIGGFKSVNDVCLFLRLKPHLQTQLEKLICVKKMKGSIRIDRYQERKLDL